MAQLFGSDAERYGRTRPGYPDVVIDRIAAASPGREVLDVDCGTARHWVDPIAGAVKAAKTLCPGGLLAVFGNVAEPPRNVQEAFAAAYRRVAPDSPLSDSAAPGRSAVDTYERLYAKAADGIRQPREFAEPRQRRFDWQHTYSRDEWLDQLPTHGSLTRLPADKLSRLLDGVGAAIDELGDRFTLTHTAIAVTATRTSAT